MWVTLILVGIISYIFYKVRSASSYWKRYGVPVNSIVPQWERFLCLFGARFQADLDEKIYKKMGSQRFCGITELSEPLLLVKDLELVKKVLIKDFDHFMDRRIFTSKDSQKIVDKMLVNMEGEEWKGVRGALTPTFTTGKIRRMMKVFNNISHDWVAHFKQALENSGKDKVEINVEKECIHYTVDTIAAAVFGMKAGTVQNPNAVFAKMAFQFIGADFIKVIKFLLVFNFPSLAKRFNLSFFDDESLNFFIAILNQGIKARREAGNDSTKQNDFLQLLIEASKGAVKAEGSDELNNFEKEAQIQGGNDKKNWLNDDEAISASMLQFFTAGFTTTSNILGLALYVLTCYPEVQTKLREEVNSQLFIKGDEQEIDYDELGKLQYLDMVVSEILRKYPVMARLERKCTKEYRDPESGMVVPKGVFVGIPVQAIHNDPEFYERPNEFYPEHFTPENKAKRSPYTFLSFGSGPRNCIGMRFALIETKAAIAHIVHNFILEPTSKTPVPMACKHVGIGIQLPPGLEIGFRFAN